MNRCSRFRGGMALAHRTAFREPELAKRIFESRQSLAVEHHSNSRVILTYSSEPQRAEIQPNFWLTNFSPAQTLLFGSNNTPSPAKFRAYVSRGTRGSNPPLSANQSVHFPTLERRKLRANCGVLSARSAPERAGRRRIRRAFSPWEIKTVRFSGLNEPRRRRSPHHRHSRRRTA